MQITLNIPDELGSRLEPFQDQIARILELGLQKWNLGPEFANLADVLETLAHLPTPKEVLELRPSPSLQDRISMLLAKNRSTGLSPDEEREWEQIQFLEHLMRLAKARAAAKLKAS